METLPRPRSSASDFVPLRMRVGLFAVPWALAYVITMPGHGPATILALPWLPLGLCDLFGITAKDTVSFICMVSWFTYVALAVGVLSAQKRIIFFVRWAILLVLLVTTAAGCHSTFKRAQYEIQQNTLP